MNQRVQVPAKDFENIGVVRSHRPTTPSARILKASETLRLRLTKSRVVHSGNFGILGAQGRESSIAVVSPYTLIL